MTLTADLDAMVVALSVPHFARSVGLEPDPWQDEFFETDSPRVALNCARQSGKSTASACVAVHRAIYGPPGTLILLVSPTLRQSGELFRKCSEIYLAGGKEVVPPKMHSQLSLELENGNRIVSLPGKENTVRAYSAVDLLLIDEASRVPTELYLAVLPMLAVSGGQLVTLSTPFGTRGWWYEEWVSDDAEQEIPWKRIEAPATACPRITTQHLMEMRFKMGSYYFEQEYLCKFLDAETQAFGRAEVDAMFVEDEEMYAPELRGIFADVAEKLGVGIEY